MAETSDSADDVPPRPSADAMAPIVKVLAPVRRLIKPKFYGIEHVPEHMALLVGNHTLYGILDVLPLYAELCEREIVPRALADHAHFRLPGIRNVMTASGAVQGTRANTRELMRRSELIIVFPGGGREVTKRKGEQYQLIWKNRLGFAVVAIENSYPIIPFASVGTEHGSDILMDADNPLMAPARKLFKTVLGTGDTPPIVRGIGLTPIPRPERLYYWFGEPIPTDSYCDVADEANAREVRSRTANAIEAGIKFLLDQRERDPGRSVVNRLLGKDSD
jgi:1-acyl-sn-glycerol-3-phosphate acyltransferase